jgi:hypothetical protein
VNVQAMIPCSTSDMHGFLVHAHRGRECLKLWFVDVTAAACLILRWRCRGWSFDLDNLLPQSCRTSNGQFTWTDRPDWIDVLREKLRSQLEYAK